MASDNMFRFGLDWIVDILIMMDDDLDSGLILYSLYRSVFFVLGFRLLILNFATCHFRLNVFCFQRLHFPRTPR
jgi:hypothetical protein